MLVDFGVSSRQIAPEGHPGIDPDELDELDELVEYHHVEPDDELDELEELVENHHWASQVDAVAPAKNRHTNDRIKRFLTDFLFINFSFHLK